jgi:HD-like signal output (HDOD) protein
MNSLKNLPALPEASLRILDAINTPDLAIDELADALSLSPGLVARLLGLANSAYFSRGRSVADIRTAIFQVLGLDLVKALALAIIFNVQFDTRNCQTFDSEQFWMRSLMTAVSAQKLAAETPLFQELTPSTVYASGLLLDIGILVLAYLCPEALDAIFTDCKQSRISVRDEIARRMGQSHFQLGYFLLNKWHLPELYQFVLQNYENQEFVGSEQPLLILLRISRRLSAAVIAGNTINSVEFDADCRSIQVGIDHVYTLAEQLMEHKTAIQKLASIMGN